MGLHLNDNSSGEFASCSFVDNGSSGIYIHESAVMDKSSFLSSNLFGNGSSYEVDIACCNNASAQA